MKITKIINKEFPDCSHKEKEDITNDLRKLYLTVNKILLEPQHTAVKNTNKQGKTFTEHKLFLSEGFSLKDKGEKK
jgi:hypothetical protein